MDVTARSRRRVDEALAALDARFGVERSIVWPWKVSPETYGRTVERFEAGTVGGAGAWVAREDGRVLLVREHEREGWSEPSGTHEPGETLAETARREAREETGVEVDLDHVALAQRAVHVDRTDDDRPPVHRLVFVFAARHAGGTARAAEPGIEAVRWFDEHPEDLLYSLLWALPIPADW
jgi:ADP-ribose pyrophosphatase YjhB (NUDIX family)